MVVSCNHSNEAGKEQNENGDMQKRSQGWELNIYIYATFLYLISRTWINKQLIKMKEIIKPNNTVMSTCDAS